MHLSEQRSYLTCPVEEIKNRATITGSIEIGRHPGVVTATLQMPKTMLKKARLFKPVKRQYDC